MKVIQALAWWPVNSECGNQEAFRDLDRVLRDLGKRPSDLAARRRTQVRLSAVQPLPKFLYRCTL